MVLDWVGRLEEEGHPRYVLLVRARLDARSRRWVDALLARSRRPTSRRSGSGPASAGCAWPRSWPRPAASA